MSKSNNSPQAAIIKDQFTALFIILKPLIDDQNNKRHTGNTSNLSLSDSSILKSLKLNKKSTLRQVSSILYEFQDGGLINTDDADLIELQKLIIIISLIILIIASSQFLLHNTLPLLDDLNYYDSVLSSQRGVFLYTLQTLPQNICNIIQSLFNDVKTKNLKANQTVLLNAIDVPTWLPKGFESLYKNLLKWLGFLSDSLVSNTKQLLKSPTSFLIEKQRLSNNSVKLFINATVGLPFYHSTTELKSKREKLVHLQEQNVKRLGLLLSELPTFSIIDTNIDMEPIHSIINKLSLAFVNLESFDLTTTLEPTPSSQSQQLSESFQKLNALYDRLLPSYKTQIQAQLTTNKQPHKLAKNWLLITLLVLYGPTMASTIMANRETIYNWVQLNLVETTIGFYQNWIVDPLNNILKTIRHDDESQIAII
ncbi:unnamed protein product [Ambrosiozyma monospora]|uniref:Unnamed protein product n=1 Tax=Ambrosiozyma monospora TaxID=43982 RepID=A0ACB5T072_AMBMO|nr:unnamed protein product [Ambrosiozyma monospora]